MIFPCMDENIQAVREACTVLLWEEVITFSWCSHGLSLIKRNLKKKEFVHEEFLHKMVNKNSVCMRIVLCYRRYSRRYMLVVKAAWFKYYEDLPVLN